jgi:hypothetical protein
MAKHGNMRLPDLPAVLANGPKMQSTNIYDRCKARHKGLTPR